MLHDLVAWRDARMDRAEIGYWRTASGVEVDFVIEAGGRLVPIEVKAGARRAAARLAVALRLHDAGWTLEDDRDGPRFHRDDVVLDPFDPARPIVSDADAARAAWAEFRQVSGLRGTVG